MIPEQFIQELLNRVDIVDVIDKSVPLKKAGANYSACCPFHNEKSPSFTVSPTKQFYHCFGCGAHGTAIGFLMEYNGLSFVEAIHDLAKNVGMIVPQEQSTPESRQADAQNKTIKLGLQETLQFKSAWFERSNCGEISNRLCASGLAEFAKCICKLRQRSPANCGFGGGERARQALR
jgi:DNA primase